MQEKSHAFINALNWKKKQAQLHVGYCSDKAKGEKNLENFFPTSKAQTSFHLELDAPFVSSEF